VNLVIFLHEKKTSNQAHFSKISIQNVWPNLYGKNDKKTEPEIEFILKLREILSNRAILLKDEGPIFPIGINMSQKVWGVLRISTSNMVKISS
jgi:hypothetical protein